ncbi:phosphate ABC transporter, phosphate-binding protein PstS [Bacteriovorax sp. BAL6_X]|uniref:phosphate ABC transporter substrate-binding protein PstS n=1 Tax=Bacteriovorax sp. BAL6_X TaxID=1201290 RepID=UPI000385EA0B|nr:phosphate ABC transporter substrate-binding protein PstS [Bacteriovorax sp. BAL6_X]EPZ52071.1 phosphate ABC transporter, phosphate-binding protein PstS [Bacteriovorax sp. BAL6_X]
MIKRIVALCLLLASTSTFALKINAAGASFPYAIYSKWFSEYSKINPEVQFNYQPIGSGGGIRQLLKETVDFGASDAPMKAKDKKKAKWPVLHVPMVLGAVAIAYNHPQVPDQLKLDGPTLADIYLGKITKWNAAQILALNPGVKLPSDDILVVRRADGSGTTKNFADYLVEVSTEWKQRVGTGKSLRWPTGVGAKGNDGVTSIVSNTKGSITYMDLAHARKNNIKTVALKNKAGLYINPTVEAVSASAKEFKTEGKELTGSLINSSAKDSYPISALTYILLPMVEKDLKQVEIYKFVEWAISKGQSYAKELYYAPLPTELSKKVLERVKSL